MSPKVIIIHGNGGGSGADHWYPAVVDALKEAGIQALAPDFPDPVLARASFWLPFLENELRADEQTVLVGHSSGAVAAMRFAETHRLLGSVLVGTYFTDLNMEDERTSGYFDTPWNWQAMRNNQQWSAIFASEDDPFIPVDEPRFVRDQLGAEYFEYADRGHFSSPHDTNFPELTAFLLPRLA